MRVVFIRHGQSAANVGLPCTSFSGIPLTDVGHAQAAERAASFDVAPHRILHSPFHRTLQTAAPTRERFPDVPVEEWDIYEFCNLHNGRWTSQNVEAKRAAENGQWGVCDPHYVDGEGAESFAAFRARVVATLERLKTLPADSLVYAFSHGLFMHAVRNTILYPNAEIGQFMRDFIPTWLDDPIDNTQTLTLDWDGTRWSIIE